MKLGQESTTSQIHGFYAMRWDRDCSGTGHCRGGGLIVCIRQCIQYTVPSCATTNPFEVMSSSTWLGAVKFPLLTSACPHIVLTTPPTTNMISCGSIIYQKNPASLRRCVSSPEDAPATPKRIGSSSEITSATVSLRCHRSIHGQAFGSLM